MTHSLKKDDLCVIKETETYLSGTIFCIEKARRFKLNDILFRRWYDGTLCKNSYGPIKYKVVHVDKNGMPYAKEMTSAGNPRGELISIYNHYVMLIEDHIGYPAVLSMEEDIFSHDPHYIEHIIIAEEGENYDPAEASRKKKILREEIIKHNKDNKIALHETKDAIEALNRMEIDQVYWLSNKTYFTVNKIETDSTIKHCGYPRGMLQARKITVTKSNGEVLQLMPHDLWRTNLYLSQPRSYKELSDTI